MGLLDQNFQLASGERVTAIAKDEIPPDHLARYEFAIECLQDMQPESILSSLIGADIFCGAGYGAHMLAQRLPCFMIGIDGSSEAIQRAAQHYVDLNLFFSHKYFPFHLPPSHFDFIVSMESIEHIENGDLLFKVFAQALKPSGRLIISAPNAAVVNLEKNPYPWHYRHYVRQEIIDMGHRYGLEHNRCMGAECTVVDPTTGKVVAGNYYSPTSGRLREDYCGDTLTHFFTKSA